MGGGGVNTIDCYGIFFLLFFFLRKTVGYTHFVFKSKHSYGYEQLEH